MTTELDRILFEKEGPIAYIILNRPDKHNAMPFDMFDELVAAVRRAEDDDDVKVIVLKGNGPSFCSGHDLTKVGHVYQMGEGREGQRRASQRSRLIFDRKIILNYQAMMFAMKPIIVQVQGHCIGAGMMLVYCADLAIASEDAQMGQIDQQLVGSGRSFTQVSAYQHFGPKKAREVLQLHPVYTGKEMVKMGAVNKAVPRDQLEATVKEWALKVARHPKDGLVMGKAWHQMTIDTMGGSSQFVYGYINHSHMTNIRWEEGEYNFFRARREEGSTSAIHDRGKYYGQRTEDGPVPEKGKE